MAQVIVTPGAARGLERCRQFLSEAGTRAKIRAAEAIERQFELPENAPEIGRPLGEKPELRELVIAFGESGYVALYRYVPSENVVFILAFRHQKEAGF